MSDTLTEEKASIANDENLELQHPSLVAVENRYLEANVGLKEYIESKRLGLKAVSHLLNFCSQLEADGCTFQNADCNRRLRRKFDWHILSIFFITSILQFLDKTALNYANLFSVRKELHLTGSQFNWLASIFYLGYLVGQLPASYLFAKFSTGRILGICTILWGVTILVFTWSRNFAGAAACRFFLGIFEAPITPGITLAMGYWWTRDEAPVRYTFVYSALGWAGIIGSLMSTGISRMSDDGPIARWQVIFVIVSSQSPLIRIQVLIVCSLDLSRRYGASSYSFIYQTRL